jgi:transposase
MNLSANRIFLYLEPVDMRSSFDRLALLVEQRLGEQPQNGSLFCFVGKSGRRLKLLWWERNGYCLLYKRLHGARFVLPERGDSASSKASLGHEQLASLLQGVELAPGELKRRCKRRRGTQTIH